jgi:peroxisomal 2,4-dienoyl-CoA reductase
MTSHSILDVFRPGLFDGRVALITGGGSGIGRGIADTLAALGAHVVLASRKQERVDAAAVEIRAAGGRASGIAVDVREQERVKEVVARVADEHGRLDVLVNNAAGNFYAPSETLTANAWKSVIEIDLYGTFFCSQAALPVMRASGGGSIVNISMTLHYRGWPQMAHATAAKGGIDALTRTLALEWAPYGVRVNAVAPGPVPTEGVLRAFARPPKSGDDLFASAQPQPSRITSDVASESGATAVDHAIAQRARQIPLGRWGTPRDIANAVAFLASPAASWVTGTILVVDGGEWLARSTT